MNRATKSLASLKMLSFFWFVCVWTSFPLCSLPPSLPPSLPSRRVVVHLPAYSLQGLLLLLLLLLLLRGGTGCCSDLVVVVGVMCV